MSYPSTSKSVLIGSETSGTAGTAGLGGGWLSGTAGTATPNDVGLIITDVSDNSSREVNESIGISSIQVQKVTSGMTDDGINFEGDFQHGRLFKFIIGSDVPVTTSADYTHNFGITNTPPAASIASQNNLTTDTVLKHVGQFVESATLSTALNQNLKLAVTFKGKTSNSSDSAAAAVLSTLPVFPHSLVTVKIDGTAATEVQNVSIAINKVVSRSGGIGSNIYQQGHGTEIRFEFSANLGFTDSKFQNLFMGGSGGGSAVLSTRDPTGFEFAIQADNRVTLGSGRRELSMTLENCIQSGFTENTSVGGLTFIDISGKGTLKELFTVDNIITL